MPERVKNHLQYSHTLGLTDSEFLIQGGLEGSLEGRSITRVVLLVWSWFESYRRFPYRRV